MKPKMTQISVDENGHISIRWMKPGTADMPPEPHRTMVPCGESIERQLQLVSDHLVSMGFESIMADLPQIQQVATVVWTEDRLAVAAEVKDLNRKAWEAQVAAAEASKMAAEAQGAAEALSRKTAFDQAVAVAVASALAASKT